MTPTTRFAVLMLLAMLTVLPPLASAQSLTEPGKAKTVVTVELVDDRGNAVGGAHVGLGDGYFSDTTWLLEKPTRSNHDGIARLSIDPSELERACLAGHDATRGLIGFTAVDTEALPSRVTVKLSPECRVTGRLVASGLAKRNERFTNGEIAIRLGDKIAVRHWSKRGDFALYLPAGKYELEAHSSGSPTHDVLRTLVVPPDKSELALGEIDLPVTRLKELEGQEAPELKDIVAWMNTEPLKLSDLRGKVVLLDFWGWWCGACTVRMPKLFELHDKYHKDGLVIIGVHLDLEEDSSVDSAEEMYEKVAADRKEFWKGREIPFPVAFVRSGSERAPFLAEGAAGTARCALAAKYGVLSYPTHVLIDRDGRVVGRFSSNREDHIELLEKTLGLRPSK